ncbi:hypothetical protein KEM55_006224 [Ascosphaera atra]|nr:hypothetical protein KEM55_006224 [Ascosphaera atra]
MSDQEKEYTIQPIQGNPGNQQPQHPQNPQQPSDDKEKSKPGVQDFVNKGPALPQDAAQMPEKESREKLEARLQELNKK